MPSDLSPAQEQGQWRHFDYCNVLASGHCSCEPPDALTFPRTVYDPDQDVPEEHDDEFTLRVPEEDYDADE